ncbi:MAG: ABC-2 family transporter protein [Chloroflexi bacterium]|nr:ABC-2 family transporter protein [Chloroflexota bacterium]
MHTLIRLAQLWRLYAWLDLVWVVRSFRFFVLYYIGFAVVALASIAGMALLAERFDGVGIWSKWQIVFLLGYGSVADGLLEMLCGFNIVHISRRIGRGQLDHMLIQPQPIWVMLVTEGVNPFGSSNIMLTGVALLVWAWGHLAIDATAGWWGWFALNVVASAAVVVAYNFIWGSLAFWAPRAAEEVNTPLKRMFDQLTIFPLDGLGGAARAGLLAGVPIGFMAWYPSRFLLGLDATPLAGLVTPLAAVAFLVVAALIFRRGMQHYMRAGSQRYRAMGHRS